MTTEMAASAHWSLDKDSIFPETAIPANIDRQNYSIFPRKFYVDIERCCIQCRRWFIFFANEQKHWFEGLGFYVDADCTKCVDCRKNDQNIKLMQKRYQILSVKKDRNAKEISELKRIALELFQLGYIKDQTKVDRIG
ncbi:zinc-ribbon domain containing protein [Microbulbifer sp. DLAB2-AA]|uniref:zinc-ribbon domain containing protein n=1 Tax=Microbulbifer sp. DLAB2-AA TaxID=3243394 RepID=UPI00403A1B55